MEVRQRGLIAGVLTAALLVAPLAAEAKRAGGGKSHGMSRQAAPTQSYQQPRQAAPVLCASRFRVRWGAGQDRPVYALAICYTSPTGESFQPSRCPG